MFSILSYNELSEDLFIPSHSFDTPKDANFKEGIQQLPNRVQISGRFTKNKLNGKFTLRFSGNKTMVKGKAKNNSMVEGVIIYNTGVKVDGYFQNNGRFDSFKEVKITFKSGYFLEARFDKEGEILEGKLYNKEKERVNRYRGESMLTYTDTKKTKGILIRNKSFYEGELERGEATGSGTEYYPFGLIYYDLKDSADEKRIANWQNFCFIGTNQFISNSKFVNGVLEQQTKVYSNGIVEKKETNFGITKTFISFEKLGYEGYIEFGKDDVLNDKKTDGSFCFKNIHLDVQFYQKNNKFFICYDKFEHSIESWNDNINMAHGKIENKEPVTEEQSIITTDSFNEMYSTLKKSNVKESSPKLKEKPKKTTKTIESSKREIKTKDPARKISDLTLESKKYQEQMIDANNQVTFLHNQLEKKEEELRKLREEVEKGSINNLNFFQGTIANGQKQGFCYEINDKGEYFEGNYIDNKKESYGKLITTAYEYTGNFENDKPKGKGRKVFKTTGKELDGEFFAANYVGNKLQIGKVIYIGDIIKDKMNGNGKLIFVNDWEFEGSFVNDEIVKNGKSGKLTNKNIGKSYEVEYKYIDELEKDVFISAKGSIYGFDFRKGMMKKLF